MTEQSGGAKVPAAVQAYLQNAAVAVADTLLLHVDQDWNYLGHEGDLARFGLQETPIAELSSLLKALCIGLPRVRGTELKHVGLPNGRFVDLHLFSSKGLVHVLFLDVRVEVEKTRAWQQSAQETELKSYEKTREIRKQRSSLSEVRQQRDQYAWALALAQGRASILRHELFAASQHGTELIAAALDRAERHAPLTRSNTPCQLGDIAQAMEKLAIAQISLARDKNDLRPIFVDPQQCATALLPLLMFAHRRAGTATPLLAASLKHERDAVVLSTFCGMQDVSTEESALAWNRKLPESRQPNSQPPHNSSHTAFWSPSDLALVLCAEHQRTMGARLTRQYTPKGGLTLVMSMPLPVARVEMPVIEAPRTRVSLAVGARCWFVSNDASLLQIAGAAIESRGLVLQPQPFSEHLLEQLMTLAPQALLIDPELPGAAKFAFSARGAGYKGLIIGLRPISGGAALKAAFDHICEAQTMTSIQTALFGSG